MASATLGHRSVKLGYRSVKLGYRSTIAWLPLGYRLADCSCDKHVDVCLAWTRSGASLPLCYTRTFVNYLSLTSTLTLSTCPPIGAFTLVMRTHTLSTIGSAAFRAFLIR